AGRVRPSGLRPRTSSLPKLQVVRGARRPTPLLCPCRRTIIDESSTRRAGMVISPVTDSCRRKCASPALARQRVVDDVAATLVSSAPGPSWAAGIVVPLQILTPARKLKRRRCLVPVVDVLHENLLSRLNLTKRHQDE